ncbi:MAG TPA: hypothetical protein VNA15_01905 [Candidatus Angelobacter sp.]|nr:hypothetical protein [Candidatus Angelobacter sp.]
MNYVTLWPTIFLFLGSYDNWFSWLVVYPAALLVAGSSLTVLGIARKRNVTPEVLDLLIFFSALPVVGTLISLFFYYGFYEEYLVECPDSGVFYKCIVVLAAGYVELYVLLALAVSTVAFIAAFRKSIKPTSSSVPNPLTCPAGP